MAITPLAARLRRQRWLSDLTAKNKRIGQGYGRAMTSGRKRHVMMRRMARVDQMFMLKMVTCNLTRMRLLEQRRLMVR